MTYRPLTANKQVDLDQVAPPATPAADRSLADLLPSAPATPAQPAPVATRAQLAGAVVACIAVLLTALYMTRSVPSAPPAAVPGTAPAAAPTAMSVPEAAAVAPQSAALPILALTRPVGAFAAPDGAYLGTIEAGRAYTPTARLGLAWTQIEAAGSGRVWIAARELQPDLSLADLAPPTPVPTSVPAPAPAQRVVVYEPAAPAPTQCATVSGGGVSVQRCGAGSYDDQQREAQAAWDVQIKRDRTLAQTVTPDTYGGKRP